MADIIEIGNRERKTTRCIVCKTRLSGGTICHVCEDTHLPKDNSAMAVCENCGSIHTLKSNLPEVHPNIRAMEFIGFFTKRHIYTIAYCKKCDPLYEKRLVSFKRLVPVD